MHSFHPHPPPRPLRSSTKVCTLHLYSYRIRSRYSHRNRRLDLYRRAVLPKNASFRYVRLIIRIFEPYISFRYPFFRSSHLFLRSKLSSRDFSHLSQKISNSAIESGSTFVEGKKINHLFFTTSRAQKSVRLIPRETFQDGENELRNSFE